MSQISQIKIQEVNFSCSAHATEDIEKVADAMLHLIPENLREEVVIEIEKLEGHAGNQINLLEISITKSNQITEILQFLAANLDDVDKQFLYEYLDERLGEDNSLYFRVNKQEAFLEKIILDDGDNTIRIVIKFVIYKQKRSVIKENLLQIGLIRKD
ncbi:MAG: RNA-binding domain-containing protein [Candidatus Thorarchaeota archaeon]